MSLISAFLVVKFTKPVLMVYTSLAFGMLANNAIMFALDSSSDGFECVVTIICIVFCFVCQYKKYGFWDSTGLSKTTFDYKSAQTFLTNVASADTDGTQSVPAQEFIYCTKGGTRIKSSMSKTVPPLFCPSTFTYSSTTIKGISISSMVYPACTPLNSFASS